MLIWHHSDGLNQSYLQQTFSPDKALDMSVTWIIHHKMYPLTYCGLVTPYMASQNFKIHSGGGNQSCDSSRHDQKVIKLRVAHNELVHQIQLKSDQYFVRSALCLVCKYAESSWPIRGQKIMVIQWNVTKVQLGQGSHILNSPTNFELNPISGLSVNAWGICSTNQRPRNCKFNEALLFRQGDAPDEFAHWIWGKSNWRFVWKYMETGSPIRGQETVRI